MQLCLSLLMLLCTVISCDIVTSTRSRHAALVLGSTQSIAAGQLIRTNCSTADGLFTNGLDFDVIKCVVSKGRNVTSHEPSRCEGQLQDFKFTTSDLKLHYHRCWWWW